VSSIGDCRIQIFVWWYYSPVLLSYADGLEYTSCAGDCNEGALGYFVWLGVHSQFFYKEAVRNIVVMRDAEGGMEECIPAGCISSKVRRSSTTPLPACEYGICEETSTVEVGG
jgi:hypothetical protein